MWIAKRQDALILGEVVEQTPDSLSKVKIMAVFPQTHFFWLGSGSTITFEDDSEYPQNLHVGGKYLMSLDWAYFKYHNKWGMLELTPDSTGFADARLLDTQMADYQYMISTGGEYPLPDPPESLENPHLNP
jgi:hypothetical protein